MNHHYDSSLLDTRDNAPTMKWMEGGLSRTCTAQQISTPEMKLGERQEIMQDGRAQCGAFLSTSSQHPHNSIRTFAKTNTIMYELIKLA